MDHLTVPPTHTHPAVCQHVGASSQPVEVKTDNRAWEAFELREEVKFPRASEGTSLLPSRTCSCGTFGRTDAASWLQQGSRSDLGSSRTRDEVG